MFCCTVFSLHPTEQQEETGGESQEAEQKPAEETPAEPQQTEEPPAEG